jgi:alanine dehydrogenase
MVLILDKKTVLDSLDLASLIDEIGEGMAALTRGEVVQPLRTRVFSTKTGGLLASLPCYLSGKELFSAKLGFSHPTLRDANGARHLTQVIAFGDTEGRLMCVMHGTLLGMYRTAACSAVVARFCTSSDAAHLAVIGCGPMGEAEVEAMLAVRPITRITVHDVNPEASARFRDAIGARTGITVEICKSNEEAVHGAAIVSLTTTSHVPVIKREWLVDHCHVAALGAHRKDYREVDSQTMLEAAVFIESVDALMAEAGDYLVPVAEGLYGTDHFVAEVGELITGSAPSQHWADRLTVFKSTGVGIQDLIIANHVYRRALRTGLGIEVEL